MDLQQSKTTVEGLFSKNESYRKENASEEQIYLYKKAYKTFKQKNKDTYAKISLDLETNTITLSNFTGLDMYKLGYEVAKAE